MRYSVTTTSIAAEEIAFIYRWIYRRSPQGAYRWDDAFTALCRDLETNPLSRPSAMDLLYLGPDIREAFFKTSHGKRYRVLFRVVNDEVRILHVRGPGQAPMQP